MPALGLRFTRPGLRSRRVPHTYVGTTDVTGFERRADNKDNDNDKDKKSGRKRRKKKVNPTSQDPPSDTGTDQEDDNDDDGSSIALNPLPLPPPSEGTTGATTGSVQATTGSGSLSVQPTPAVPSPTSESIIHVPFATETVGATTATLDAEPSVVVCTPGMVGCVSPTLASGKTALTGATASPSMIVGPLVGGLVGGLVFIALIVAGLLLYIRRRRRTHVAPSAQFLGRNMSTANGSVASSFRRLPSTYSGSSRSTTPSLGMRSTAESLRGGSPSPPNVPARDGHLY